MVVHSVISRFSRMRAACLSLLCLEILAWSPLPAQDSSFRLTARTPETRFPGYYGNGRIGTVTSPRGIDPTPSYLAGVCDHAPGDVPRIAALPAWSEIDVFDGRSWLRQAPLAETVLQRYEQTVNMHEGTVRTTYDWVDGPRRTSVTVEAFISRSRPELAVLHLELVPHHSGPVRVVFTLRAWPPPRRLPLERLERIDPGGGPSRLWYPGHMVVHQAQVAPSEGTRARFWMTSRPEGRPTLVAEAVEVSWERALAGAVTRPIRSDTLIGVEVSFPAHPGVRYTFDKLVSITSSKEGPAPLTRAARALDRARAAGYAALRAEHAAAWRRLWETDIVLEGDPELQRVVRAMLYALLTSARSGAATSIPPMGLSSAGYYGHVFWDADTWMFPALLVTHPDIARSLVAFRARTLPAARANARRNGYDGAMYPWEAGELGEETTPRFAAQNARSEIHITGDVAIAQWQYYLATGDSAWLARTGYPVIRAAAAFWVSRVSFDSARGRYELRNVVSVDEGLIGVTNDVYTNAVARRTLEIAGRASRVLGARADPRWAVIAAKLDVPYDSTHRYHPTYEGAPPATRGSVAPLLAYPLGMRMPEAVKRIDLEHALARTRAEGPGAMMTVTLYPVIAAELGERALVDSLLPGTYRPYLRGPFLMLAETPRNDAVSFVTGAGGVLQQVLFGYTGLRFTDRGLAPVVRPLLPSRVRRLELRNIPIRGARYHVIVEGDSLRMVALGERARRRPAAAPDSEPRAEPRRARGRGPAPGGIVEPVLAFPDPALDDTSAYQGYRTRFFRDSRGNTVQIYLDGRSGRVVHVWADAADESIAFTVRDTAGRPAAVVWGASGARVADSGRVRVLTYELRAPAPIEIGWFLLGSMRVERDFQYARGHLAPFGDRGARSVGQRELVALIATLERLDPVERRRQLALLGAASVAELRARLTPTIRCRPSPDCTQVRITQPSFDGRTHLTLELRVRPGAVAVRADRGTVTVYSRVGGPVHLAVAVATDAAALTPLRREEIFRPEFLAFLARAIGSPTPS